METSSMSLTTYLLKSTMVSIENWSASTMQASKRFSTWVSTTWLNLLADEYCMHFEHVVRSPKSWKNRTWLGAVYRLFLGLILLWHSNRQSESWIRIRVRAYAFIAEYKEQKRDRMISLSLVQSICEKYGLRNTNLF